VGGGPPDPGHPAGRRRRGGAGLRQQGRELTCPEGQRARPRREWCWCGDLNAGSLHHPPALPEPTMPQDPPDAVHAPPVLPCASPIVSLAQTLGLSLLVLLAASTGDLQVASPARRASADLTPLEGRGGAGSGHCPTSHRAASQSGADAICPRPLQAHTTRNTP
jgi:hypothetical protein